MAGSVCAQRVDWQGLLLGDAPAPSLPVLPVLFGVRQWNCSPDWREKYRALKKLEGLLRRGLLTGDPTGDCLRLDEGHLLAVCAAPMAQPEAAGICRDIITQCSQALPCEVGCCVGCPAPAAELSPMVDRLLALEQEHLSSCRVLLLGSETVFQPIPDDLLTGWRYLLMDESFDQMLTEAAEFFMAPGHSFSSEALHRFHPDFIQLLYGVMGEKRVPAHVLFDRSENARCFRDAPDSIANTLTWIFSAVTALSGYLEQRRKSQDYTQQAREYILSHLSENLSRQEIADHVHLSQNHLARLFRQETGSSISDFILQQRMQQAFGLLANTSLPVGQVAQQVGYENYSYFLTLFRRVSGKTPSQYREKYSSIKEESHHG